jgi:hypothetical protein
MLTRIASRSVALLLILSTTLFSVGCTKEKAEAVKTAAEQFRLEGHSGLAMTTDLIKKTVDTPVDTKEEELNKLVKDFNQIEKSTGVKRTPTQVQAFVEEVLRTGEENRVVNAAVDAEFKSLFDDYDLFASMFRSLPRGHFFAKGAVAQSERHAVRLTLRFVKMASTLRRIDIPFTANRIILMNKMLRAQEMTDAVARQQALMIAAQDAIKLREDERLAKELTIAQLLKAAEAGRLITELIHNFQKLTVQDILDLTRDSLAILNSMTGNSNKDIKGMQNRFEAFVKNKINQDPLWRDVLNNELNGNALLGSVR